MIKNSFLKKGFWQLKILLIIFCSCFAFSVSAASFTLNLSKGWNIISIPLQPNSTDIKVVLAPIAGKYSQVIGSSGAFDPSLSDSFNSLKTIEPGKGYEIKMLQAATLTISGTKLNYSIPQWVSSLSLPAGWNEIGVTLNSPVVLSSANLSPYNYIVQTYNPYETDKTLLQAFSDPNGRKDFTMFDPGKGYWVKIKDKCSVDVDCSDFAGYCSTAYPNIKCNTASGSCYCVAGSSLPSQAIHMKLDENVGQYVYDASNSSLYGTLGVTSAVASDDPLWTSDNYCKLGSCLSFDGVNDTLVFDNMPVNTASGGKNTVAFWMYWKGKNGVMPFGWNTSYDLFLYNDTFGFNTGNGNVEGFSGTDYLKNGWHYVVAVFPNGQAPNSTNAALWIDGVNKGVVHRFGSGPTAKTATDKIFLSGYGTGYYNFDGIIDDFKLYNRELSDVEIKDLYSNSLADVILPQKKSSLLEMETMLANISLLIADLVQDLKNFFGR